MNKIRIFLPALALFFYTQCAYSQDISLPVLHVDTAFALQSIATFIGPVSGDFLLLHSPAKEDTLFLKKHSKLITAEPAKNNYSDYYALACSLWEFSRLEEAEKMFLKIITSKAPYYNEIYYSSTDIPGDTTTNRYGYGSSTSSYKNGTSIYLAKIYVEEKKFTEGLNYITAADKKYKVVQNCGTGYMWYRSEIEGLYGLCYDGQGQYDSIINLYLPNNVNWNNALLIRALKKVYSRTAIDEYLAIAEKSVVCVVDTFQSSSYTMRNFEETSKFMTEKKYTSGTATATLFGKKVTLPTPDLENGETATRALFVKNFKESGFYTALKEEE